MWQPATVPLRIDDDGGNGNDLLNAVFDGSYTDTVTEEAELMKAISTPDWTPIR